MYAGIGWRVFPVHEITPHGHCSCHRGTECERPGKHPRIGEDWNAEATTDRVKIEGWWQRWPTASIGIVCGEGSNLTVVDADASDGKPGLINLTTMCAQHGGLPPTLVVETGGGGLHLYFKFNARLATGNDVLAKAIDVRNNGGYVIAPPSLHKSGKRYKWRADRGDLQELPDWFRVAERARGRGRPRTRAAMRVEKVASMLEKIDPDDRDKWRNVGLILGRMYVGTPAENEGWEMYLTWAKRSEKWDDDPTGNETLMREHYQELSQEPPRAGREPLTVASLFTWAREGGWSPFGDRVAVPYEAGSEANMCVELIKALTDNAERNRFFNVMGEVRDVLRAPTPQVRIVQEAHSEGRPVPETLQVRKTVPSTLQCALSEVAVLSTRSRSGEDVAMTIPESLVRMMLNDRASDFPTLSGIAEWPMVGLGGSLIMRPHGYDEATGLYFDIRNGLALRSVNPDAAWRYISEEFLADFPFENDLHRAGALAMLLAFMQRPLMKTCPAFAVIAPQPGTGKSTLVEICSLAVHGSHIAAHAFSEEDEELRKALHALMIAKVPAVLFDNVGRGKAIASDHLSKLITSEMAADRVLGSSQMRKEVNSTLLLFTGNNIAFVKDMASRVVALRLNARTANPLRRRFKRPDVRVWAATQRAQMLSSLVAVAGLADGSRPPGDASRFEDYDLMIVKPVLDVTGKDVRELNTVVDVDAEEDEATRAVLETLWKWQEQWRGEGERGKEWRISEVVTAIAERNMPEANAMLVKQFVGDSRRWESDAPRALGYALRAVKEDYKYAPYVLISKPNDHGARWIVKHNG